MNTHTEGQRAAMSNLAPATRLTWHVNAIDKRGNIVGDETSEGWEKLHIGGANATVARAYRAEDARYIVHSANSYPRLVAAIKAWLPPTESEYGSQDAAMVALLRELGEL